LWDMQVRQKMTPILRALLTGVLLHRQVITTDSQVAVLMCQWISRGSISS
jgi:hypothetical protein